MEFKRVKLLSTNNYKTVKGEKLGYKTYILYLSPFTKNSKGINLCPHASKGCAMACLFKSGFGGMYEKVEQGRKNKTEWFLENRADFMNTLVEEITAAINRHKKTNNYNIAFRLNGTSDIRWEKIKVKDGKNIFQLFPDVQFYDYTKNPKRFDIELPANYHLTFSRSESNHKDAIRLLKRGVNVAIVFKKLPETFEGFKVIVGDETDLRFKDETDLRFKDDKGVVVGLTYKVNTGKGSEVANKFAKESGFVVMP